jgi:YidC/Oxa1 family membrane protein insertase
VGILNPLYDLVGWLIMHIHAVLAVPFGPASGVTWALVIVVLVVLMRLALLPLFIKQMHSQRKMIALAPELQALRKRYKGDKQKLQEEMMKLYKEHGANPLSGCLPLVAQLPLWFALLNVLRAMSEDKALYGLTPLVVHQANSAKIFGATISSKFLFQHPPTAGNVKVVIGITVVISAVTTFLSVRQSMKRGLMQNPTAGDDNPMAGAQKYMVYIAPLFALSGLYWQFGLVLYWMTSNIWQLGQQYFLFKKIPPLDKAPAAATAGAGVPGKAPAAAIQPAARAKAGSTQAGRAKAGNAQAAAGVGRQAWCRCGQARRDREGRRRAASRSGQVVRLRPAAGNHGEPAGAEAASDREEACRGEGRAGHAWHTAADPEREQRAAAQAGQGARRARGGGPRAARGHAGQAAAAKAVAEQAHGQAMTGSPVRGGSPARTNLVGEDLRSYG